MQLTHKGPTWAEAQLDKVVAQACIAGRNTDVCCCRQAHATPHCCPIDCCYAHDGQRAQGQESFVKLRQHL